SHQWQWRLPDWAAAATAGLVGGAVLMVLELLWQATVSGSSPWRASHLIAAIVMGPDAQASAGFDVRVVAVALLTHYVLGIVFGLVLAAVIAGFHYEANPGVLQLIGVVFGSALYLLNFHGMAYFFPWMAELRGWATFIGHLVFGLTVVMTYRQLHRRSDT
ncbi:MAG TPA: hypothetical protein VGP22_11580, partial [Albitalea sp.]|nr:hypothetical protein [Albitalea sp.]